LLSTSDSETESSGFTDDREPTAVSNPEAYDAIFDETGIIHVQTFSDLDSASYVMKMEDGTVYCMDYGYKNGVIKKYVETVYFPIEPTYDAEWSKKGTQLMDQQKENFAEVESLDFAKVTYSFCGYGVMVKIEYNDMDKKENITDLYELTKKVALPTDYLSMAETEDQLIKDGFIKE